MLPAKTWLMRGQRSEARLKQQEAEAALDAVRAAHRACPVVIEELKTQISTLRDCRVGPSRRSVGAISRTASSRDWGSRRGTSAPAMKIDQQMA